MAQLVTTTTNIMFLCGKIFPSQSFFFYFSAVVHSRLIPRGLTRLLVCLFFLQFRLFGPGQAFGPGVSGLLYAGGHSFRRTSRGGKMKSHTTKTLTGC